MNELINESHSYSFSHEVHYSCLTEQRPAQVLQAMPQPEASVPPAEEKGEPIASAPEQAERIWIPPTPTPSSLQPAKATVYAMLIGQVCSCFLLFFWPYTQLSVSHPMALAIAVISLCMICCPID